MGLLILEYANGTDRECARAPEIGCTQPFTPPPRGDEEQAAGCLVDSPNLFSRSTNYETREVGNDVCSAQSLGNRESGPVP
jgi:hypothetical protein